jgi:hypothetical protein
VKIKGIKRGQIIELLESIDIPDGVEITMEVEFQPLSEQERLTKLNQIFGIWKDEYDMMKYLLRLTENVMLISVEQ